MRNAILIFLLLALTSCSQENDTKIHITGEFPIIEDSYAILFIDKKDRSIELKTTLRDGKFDIPVDSLEAGVYTLYISFPWPAGKNDLIYRDDEGKVVTKTSNTASNIAFTKKIYINPEQSLQYHVQPENTITEEMIRNFDEQEYNKTNLYFVETITSSEDAKVYEKLDRAYQYFTGLSKHKILDSLYRNSPVPDKIYQDFSGRANELNFEQHYAGFLKEKRAIIAGHLDNPVAALDVLMVNEEVFRAEAEEYENLINNMVGRAKASPYFSRAKIKLDKLSFELEEGQLLPMPTGKTPESTALAYEPSDFKYTLVEFWASWCGPCRVNNPTWNTLLGAYQAEGFQILGVSLDASSQPWEKAIAQDKLRDWLHVSDLEDGFTSANALRYGIQAIPFNILIDQQGRIIKKDIAPDALEMFLKEKLVE